MLIGALEAGGTKMVCSIGTPQGGVLQRASFPTLTPDVTVPQIAEFILDRDYTNFLTLQTVFSDLTETGLAHSKTILNRTQLSLTEEGKTTCRHGHSAPSSRCCVAHTSSS